MRKKVNLAKKISKTKCICLFEVEIEPPTKSKLHFWAISFKFHVTIVQDKTKAFLTE